MEEHPSRYGFLPGCVFQEIPRLPHPSYLKPEPPPASESSVGGLTAGLKGKTKSNSPNDRGDTEIKKLLFLQPARLGCYGG